MKKLMSIGLSLCMLTSTPVFGGSEISQDVTSNYVYTNQESSLRNLTPPTEVTPSYHVSGDWSGTENFYYSPYILEGGFNRFIINSNEPFILEIHCANGEWTSTWVPEYSEILDLYNFTSVPLFSNENIYFKLINKGINPPTIATYDVVNFTTDTPS